jgi:hypothetical protein
MLREQSSIPNRYFSYRYPGLRPSQPPTQIVLRQSDLCVKLTTQFLLVRRLKIRVYGDLLPLSHTFPLCGVYM